jgi:hypothetical protein
MLHAIQHFTSPTHLDPEDTDTHGDLLPCEPGVPQLVQEQDPIAVVGAQQPDHDPGGGTCNFGIKALLP